MHQELKFMPLGTRRHFHMVKFVYKGVHGLLSWYKTSKFIPVAAPGIYVMRSMSRGDLMVPKCQLVMTNNALSVSGPVTWKQLPQEIRQADSVNELKTAYFQYYGFL